MTTADYVVVTSPRSQFSSSSSSSAAAMSSQAAASEHTNQIPVRKD